MGKPTPNYTIQHGIEWLAVRKWNIKKNEIDTILGTLKFNDSDPDIVIPLDL
jgi:hypothetical protein